MEIKYTANDSSWGTHRIIARQIGNNNKVILDVGCNKGYLQKFAPNNAYYGIDSDSSSLAEAGRVYNSVFEVDLNSCYEDFNPGFKFDTIVFADVLEHILFPETVLTFFGQKFLKDGGEVIVSLPNVAHLSIKLKLLFGDFTYADAGILDRTHLHLYTLKTARELIRKSGLVISREHFSSNNFGPIIKALPFLSTLLGFNLVFTCKKEY